MEQEHRQDGSWLRNLALVAMALFAAACIIGLIWVTYQGIELLAEGLTKLDPSANQGPMPLPGWPFD